MQRAQTEESSPSTRLASLTEYRNKAAPKAKALLEKLFQSLPDSFQNKKEIRVLVVGAGSFPSYSPFMRALSDRLCQLQQVHFTLVEPVKSETDLFVMHFAEMDKFSEVPQVDFSICNKSIKDFLQAPEQDTFDVVYFEHPETMTLPVFLAQVGFKKYNRVLMLRESIPLFAKVTAPGACVVACCMSRHELIQLNHLLQFGLGMSSQLICSRNPFHYFYAGPFYVGLIGEVRSLPQSAALQNQRVSVIKKSHAYLFYAILLSFVIYSLKIFYPYGLNSQAMIVLCMGAQLYLHRPGHLGLFVKLLLLMGQVVA